MTTTSSSLEYIIAKKLISESIARNRLADVPVILTVMAVLCDEKISYDVSHVSNRQISVAEQLIEVLKKSQAPLRIPQFIDFASKLYDEQISSVDIYLTSDTVYTSEVKDRIAHMCMTICGVKKFTLHEKISVDHGGGFIVRFRDYIMDASYGRQLSSSV